MKEKLKLFAGVLLGNALLAFAICAFVVPNGFMLGGSTGIALAVQHFWPGISLSVITAVINVALFVIGWVCMGKKFAAASALSTVIYPGFMALFEWLPVGTLFQSDILTCALFASVLAGLGIGIVVRVGGSTGGMDIPPCILQKYKGIPVGDSLMAFDSVIVITQVILNGLDGVLHSILILFLISAVINRTVISGERKVQIIIISPDYEKIRQEILQTLDGGATMLNIETGYTAEQQKAVFCVTYNKKYPAVRDAALRVDPKAFIVTADVKNVNGRGYTFARKENP